MDKNVLVIAGSSEIAAEALKLILNAGFRVYLTSRSKVDFEHKNLFKYRLDVASIKSFEDLKPMLAGIEFYSIINCAGVAVSSPVEFLHESELQRQLDVNLFGLLRIIKHFSGSLEPNGRIINLSSMATYGLYPYLSPYCLSKAASDIMLRAFSNESGIKYVSVRPGAIRTKFWNESIAQNEANFKNFTGKYECAGKFMIKNAKKNAQSALLPCYVGKAIFKALIAKNPKCVINVGLDAKICAFASRFLSEEFLNKIIKFALELRTK